MKISKTMVLPLIVAAFLVAGRAAKADTLLSIVLDNPSQNAANGVPVAGGTELTFSATIYNIGPWTADLYGDSFTLEPLTADITLDGSDLFSIPEYLPSGENTGDVDLFTATIDSGTLPGDYAGVIDIQNMYGTVIGSADFDITVAATPEPDTIFLLGTGLLLLAAMIFWRRDPKVKTNLLA